MTTPFPIGAPIGRGDLAHLAATHRLVPITRTLFADAETPVGVYRKLAAGRINTFLLESAEPGASFSRWSFVGVDAVAALSVADGAATWSGDVPAGVPTTGDPLEVLGAAWRAIKAPRLPGLPPLTGGLVGYLGYDVVRRIEQLPDKAVDELGLPKLTMLLVTDLAAVDHHECTVVLIANALLAPGMSGIELDAAYADAVRRLDVMQAALATPSEPTVATVGAAPPKDAQSRTPAGEYEPAVEQALEAVRAGEVFQIQVGQRFVAETDAEPLDVYRVLRTLNPSPYMYFLRTADVDIVGSSPEALVTVKDGTAVLHPIAGTRRRGDTPEQDAALAAELVSDEKERAEHVMLVDLARNDLGRVSAPGSVEVVEFGAVERYSHVWHIVSSVRSTVAEGMDAFDVLTATFPAGTLTGAPKVRAMELIDELEPVRRNVYGGAVGYLDAAGDLDMAIAIRTAVMRDGKAYVQAAAGVVADSIPANEEQETRNKARAVLQAIATAETLRTVT
ncbi:anthranilate synthase component I [uncultured Jatrophihabitans sp.]|uniref:anthranilate synthase component I n=1 Tax=uncultured Jatrophihabitans sp. TaxID=1610747 RepID=UPI0035CAECEE